MVKEALTQSNRSNNTRKRLLDAALYTLVKRGYHSASIDEILKRSKVSKGGLFHHFKSKKILLAAANEYLLNKFVKDVGTLAVDVSGGNISIEEFLDSLWEMTSGQFFFVTVELAATSRTDKELFDLLQPQILKYREEINQIWIDCFQESESSQKVSVVMHLNLIMCVYRGASMLTIYGTDSDFFQHLIATTKQLLVYNLEPK